MDKFFKYYFLLVFALTACEQIYTPKIESRESVIVADARIVDGKSDNFIRLYESKGFNDDSNKYPNIVGAQVYIVDNNYDEVKLNESADGIFPVTVNLNPDNKYKIRIEYGGNTFESSFEPVPEIPDLDTVYGIAGTKIIQQSGDNNVNDFKEVAGVQLYADILTKNDLPYYKFTARKVIQYTYPVLDEEEVWQTMYAWLSTYPKDLYNIASPPEFSTSTEILKHPLFFMEKSVRSSVDSGYYFAGWILILNQCGLSESGYNYYDDLNNQLGSEGRLFDPLYVQARSNLKCVNDSKQLILGNFEISSFKEHRFFVQFMSNKTGYLVKPIPYFYEIPLSGKQMTYPPDFWEYNGKQYPDEE